MLDHASCDSLVNLLLRVDRESTDVVTSRPAVERSYMAGSDIQQDGSSFPGSSQVTLIPPTQDDRGSTANGNLQVPTNQGNPEHNNPFVHSETQTTPTELSFAEKLQKQKDDLNAGYIEFEENLKTRNTKEDDMTELDWDRLQAEYEREVSSIALQERELIEQFDARFKVRTPCSENRELTRISNLCYGCKSLTKESLKEPRKGMPPL